MTNIGCTLHPTVSAGSCTSMKPKTTSWIFSIDGHLFSLRSSIQAPFRDDEVLYSRLARPQEDTEVWYASRRLADRARLVGEKHARGEMVAAGSKLNPLLQEPTQYLHG
jgi:hypothetical protein